MKIDGERQVDGKRGKRKREIDIERIVHGCASVFK